MHQAKTRKAIHHTLEADDLAAVTFFLQKDARGRPEPAGAHGHDTETPVGWRAIKAIGDAAKALVKFDYEYLRDMARKLFCALSHETAGKKRGKASSIPCDGHEIWST